MQAASSVTLFVSSALRNVGQPPASSVRFASSAALVVFLMVAAGALFWIWSPGPESRAIRDLPEPERHVLYERTLATLHSPCDPAHGSDGLKDYCREQAEFIVQFPECDVACASLARRYLASPAR